MFPNRFSIYLHDTPARGLFDKTKRAFSSGCIRVEKPIELAAYLLADNPKWNLQELIAAVDSKKTRAISLPDPINIHILYWTAWVDEDGTAHFREDIYGRDRQLNIALNEKATSPEVLYGENSGKKYLSSGNHLSAGHPYEYIWVVDGKQHFHPLTQFTDRPNRKKPSGNLCSPFQVLYKHGEGKGQNKI